MKHLFPKLVFVIFLVLGISSFVFLGNKDQKQDKQELGNTRFTTEMQNGISEREPRM